MESGEHIWVVEQPDPPAGFHKRSEEFILCVWELKAKIEIKSALLFRYKNSEYKLEKNALVGRYGPRGVLVGAHCFGHIPLKLENTISKFTSRIRV